MELSRMIEDRRQKLWSTRRKKVEGEAAPSVGYLYEVYTVNLLELGWED